MKKYRSLSLIILILWVIVGVFILIAPQPVAKFQYACTWVSLLCFIGLNLLKTEG